MIIPRATLQERLERESYQVIWVQSLAEAKLSLAANVFDLLILDVGLPDGSGFELAQQIKTTPFIL